MVAHYRHSYPVLDWGWLLPALAQLRLVGEPRPTVTLFLAGYRLESAQSLIERLCQVVWLLVVEAEGCLRAETGFRATMSGSDTGRG